MERLTEQAARGNNGLCEPNHAKRRPEGQAGRAYENDQRASDDERRHQSHHKTEKTPDRATIKTPGGTSRTPRQ